MRGGNRGTVAYPLMQTEPAQTAQATFFRNAARKPTLYHRSSRNNGSGATPRNPPSGCEDERRASNKPRVNGKTAKGSRPVNAGAITLRDKPNVSEEAREKPGKRGLGRKHGGFLPGVWHSMLKKHNLCTERIADCTPRFFTDVYGWLRMRHANHRASASRAFTVQCL